MLRRLKRLLGVSPSPDPQPPPEDLQGAASDAETVPPGPSAGSGIAAESAGEAPSVETIHTRDIDTDALKILGRLSRHGHTAYLVGGCVRDLLLGRRPKDFDISTSATPRQVKHLFRNSRIIGRRFKLAHIFFRNESPGRREKIIEVATFRAMHGSGGDPDDLLITRDNVFGTPEEDAERRDFTVNAFFYDPARREVIDHVGGLPDLHGRILRTIGDPDIRLREDPIRILRAIKFAARLGFRIHPSTMAAMERHRTDIPRCAPPRILEEFLRIMRSGASVPAFGLLGESRVLTVLLPEVDRALSGTPSMVDAFPALLSEFDRRSLAGEELGTAVILASLFLPLMPWQANADPRTRDLQGALAETVEPVLERMQIPRRDTEQVRRILLSIRKMVPGYQAKRFSRSGLARRPYFRGLLTVFSIHCHATRSWMAGLREWEELAARVEPEVEEEPPRRRRRRRPAGGRVGSGDSRGAEPGARSADEEPAPPARRRRRRRRPHPTGAGDQSS